MRATDGCEPRRNASHGGCESRRGARHGGKRAMEGCEPRKGARHGGAYFYYLKKTLLATRKREGRRKKHRRLPAGKFVEPSRFLIRESTSRLAGFRNRLGRSCPGAGLLRAQAPGAFRCWCFSCGSGSGSRCGGGRGRRRCGGRFVGVLWCCLEQPSNSGQTDRG